MGYIKFDKTQLINLEYSLQKEMVRSNRSGSFSCTTIIGCNTRKYHGLLISEQPGLDGDHHVLLSKIDETIIQRDAEFNLGVNKYPGRFHPKGHKYVRDFTAERVPVVTYRVGGVVLTKETLFVTEKEMVLVRYTLKEAHSPTRIRLRPFLAFRNIHRLSKRNIDLNTRYTNLRNGIKVRMYDVYPGLFMQLSKKDFEYVHAPDWYNDIEYIHEAERGYENHEDLYVPGFFETSIKKGESVVLSASTEEAYPSALSRIFNNEINKRKPRSSFHNSILNAAEQFFVIKGGGASLATGFPWIPFSGRYSFIALPGLMSAAPQKGICRKVIDSMVSRLSGPLFYESTENKRPVYNSADTSLWFFHALQQCLPATAKPTLWKHYGTVIKNILGAYTKGKVLGTEVHDNGLVHIDPEYPALSWMNATVNGRAQTPRYGYVVEVNALWYNALKYSTEIAREAGDKKFLDRWEAILEKLEDSFVSVFWSDKDSMLADYVFDGVRNLSVRPNMVIAAGLELSPLSNPQVKEILDTATSQLLTKRGLRTLSPRDPFYKGRYHGDASKRDAAYHQGTVWVWPLGFYAAAWRKVYGKKGMDHIKQIYEGFEETLWEAGIGTVSEIFEGDPPHKACGAISFAPSLGELLRIEKML